MQSLTNNEIAKVLGMYLGCKTTSFKPYSVVTGFNIDTIDTDNKLLLTPLENISDEDAIVMDSIVDKYKGDAIGYAYIYLYLITRAYSVPMYFGIDHPCNGKTPIDLNIAIAKPN